MEKHLRPFVFVLLLALLAHCSGFPTDEEAKTRQEELEVTGRSEDTPSHLLEKEHRAQTDTLKDAVDKVLTSKTAAAVESMASSIVKLAGGVVEDLGDLVVKTIDQLPDAIEIVGETVGKAVESNREKVISLVKETNLEKTVTMADTAAKRIATAVENSEIQDSLKKFEGALASLLGKFIGVTYKNADGISNALSTTFKRIGGFKGSDEEELKVLSRSNKDS